MADIFISYSREDRDRVEPLAARLVLHAVEAHAADETDERDDEEQDVVSPRGPNQCEEVDYGPCGKQRGVQLRARGRLLARVSRIQLQRLPRRLAR